MRSLRRQLTVTLTAGAVLFCGLLYLLVAGTIRQLAEDQVASRLEHDAETLLAALETAADGTARLTAPGPHPIYQRPFSGHYYRVDAGDTTLHSRSLWDLDLPPTKGPLAHVDGPRGQPLLVYRRTYQRQGEAVTVTVAEELTALERSIERFQRRYALVNGLLLLALLTLQAVALHRGLRPIEATRRDLERLERGEITALPERGPDEIAPLLGAFNAAHAAMDRRLERSRKGLGNLAHALKTPLAILGQLAAHPALDKQQSLRTTLQAEADTIGASVDRELQRARIAGFATAGTRIELATVVTDLATTLGQLYRERELDLDCRVPAGLRLRIDPHDLHELLGNLLDNACKWAVREVRITSREAAGRLLIGIDDDGPGVPDDRLAELTARGARLDETISGHGLGLAIATDIAAQYGGELRLARGRNGGMSVTVDLPQSVVSVP